MPGGALTASLPDIDARRKWRRRLFGCERWVTDGGLQWMRLTEDAWTLGRVRKTRAMVDALPRMLQGSHKL